MNKPTRTILAAMAMAQVAWMDAHGGSIAGYVATYGPAGLDGIAIYNADQAHLNAILAVTGGLPPERKNGMRRPKA